MIRVLGLSVLVTMLLFTITLTSVGAISPSRPQNSPNGRADQGCVNQGSDLRLAAPLVCGLQRELSWKSENPPHLFRVGNRRRTHIEIAWPPYMVFNSPNARGEWRMFRVGVRYDRTWRGYIFPTAAFKVIDHPLQY
jgi:hypothetical protein